MPVAGAVVNNASLVFNSGGTVTLNGAISGSGTLTKNGSGTVIIGGNNSYNGATNVGGYDVGSGTLRVTNSNALGSSAVTIGGHNTCTSRLEFDGGSGSGGLTISNAITLSGRSDGTTPGINLAPHIINLAGNNSITTAISMALNGSDYIIQSDAGKLTLNSITNNSGNANTRYVYLQGVGEGLVQGTIGNGTGTGAVNLIKDGAGMWTLSALNTYSGDTTVNGGTLTIAGGIDQTGTSLIDIQSGTAVLETVNVNKTNLNINTAALATFEVVNGTHTVGAISGSGTTQIDAGASLTVASIYQDTLIFGSGAKLNIQAIPGGLQGNTIAPVPEPSTLVLFGIGALGLIASAWRHRIWA